MRATWPASCLQELLEHLKGAGGSSSGSPASSSPNSSDDQGNKPGAEQPLRRSQRLWASVTPAAVESMQGISTAELAGQHLGWVLLQADARVLQAEGESIAYLYWAQHADGQSLVLKPMRWLKMLSGVSLGVAGRQAAAGRVQQLGSSPLIPLIQGLPAV